MAMETLMHNTDPLGALLGDASDINFDNGGTDLTSDNVQGAIEELTSAENIAYDSNNSVKDKIDTKANLSDLINVDNWYKIFSSSWIDFSGNKFIFCKYLFLLALLSSFGRIIFSVLLLSLLLLFVITIFSFGAISFISFVFSSIWFSLIDVLSTSFLYLLSLVF